MRFPFRLSHRAVHPTGISSTLGRNFELLDFPRPCVLSYEVERDKMERFEEKLNEKNQTKAEWLNKKIDEELGK